ncbi:anthranilate synthase component I family protein [Flavobacterium johnsoniae]|uniref:Anthranilate synthase component I and chorismate binding protein n=1 Tax=Flavobacterium johnsoniae (strain ATCC 17061 / DSM 2064 / JCM 8514 / BCRC 14874 / CCUG 350202 / NBRC 14942 / NCIMB 11054 / UW101) TaxID=376686 RepID=A5FI14_FLAJ1|nr:anthranilate synthase component I family protein [Flavobacterium johnsoniae]ABQ05165.1 Anthranilate synthase component I and chorismate binding protein [Flavobacterium johnsoniae UW101]OXG00216.1 aminodeoxychorismate synthase component I [Flavobacterium johnsoniae UW101]WQG83032.1 anthranilate synthase component I family protein [Flavobacterium johnsoniae UW101]SHL65340.1 para-aminobenzoate synthetase component 1 [Flavobacterium johnsoniae]
MRVSIHKHISNPFDFKQQLLSWSQQFREVVFLEGNGYPEQYSSFDCILAVDAFTSIKTDFHNAFEDLKQYQQTTKDWLFGYLSYDLKNDIEDLKSNNFDGLEFPDLFFFQPKKVFLLKGNELEIQYLLFCNDEFEDDFNEIVENQKSKAESSASIKIEQRISKDLYVEKVNQMLHHIHIGDMYEANFCMEFYAENVVIDPQEKFRKLNEISQAPFSVFFKNHKHFLLSASPERYLKKVGETIISQPIKGTSKRAADPVEDEKSKVMLASDEKERAENIMITDLVRNDLSHTAQKGSVEVKELCGIYSFLQVHQMISTVVSKLDKQYSAVDVLKSTFPMGSMTGAPKISVMKIIENLEETKRGLYSGAVGYFTPEGDFDFNVVIRSILYNQEKQYVSFSVGSAITSKSIPEKEYEECLLKARAMHEVLR